MMIFREAVRSVKSDKTRAALYWVTLVLTTMLIYLFSNILDCNPDTNALRIQSTTWVSVLLGSDNFVILAPLLIVLCCVDVFIAHNFYITGKTEDLQVRMTCGTSFMRMGRYLLLQTLIIMIASVPVGILLAVCAVPLLNQFFPLLSNGSYSIALSANGLYESTSVIALLILYLFIIDVGFTYQNSSGLMPNKNSELRKPKEQISVMSIKISSRTMRIFWSFLFLLSIVLIYLNLHLILISVILGMYAFIKCRNTILPELFNKVMKTKESNIVSFVSIGFLRADIQKISVYITAFVISTTVFLTIYTSSQAKPSVLLTSLIAYIITTVLQAMIVMFCFSVELSDRRPQYESLSCIGLSPDKEQRIRRKEVFYVYLFVLLLTFLYVMSYLIHLAAAKQITILSSLLLLGIIAIAILICGLMNQKTFSKINMYSAADK